MAEFHPPNNSYKRHVEKYWQDVLKIPKDENPCTATDGSRQVVSTDPVCLAHNWSGLPVTREIKDTISSDKSIFIPVSPVVITAVESRDGPEARKLSAHAREDQDTASEATLTIDSEVYHLKDLREYRFHHGAFEVDIAPNAVGSLEPSGKCEAVADGYYVMIKGLSDGEHTIRFQATVDEPYAESERPGPWTQDVTYKFVVG